APGLRAGPGRRHSAADRVRNGETVMWFSSVLGRPTATRKPTPRGRPALVRPRKFVPAVEALEGRDTPSTTVLTVSPNPATAGQAVTLTATVTESVPGD